MMVEAENKVTLSHFREMMKVIRCVLLSDEYHGCDNINYVNLLKFALRHRVIGIVYPAVKQFLSRESADKFEVDFLVNMHQAEVQNTVASEVFAELERMGVEYLPFKGYNLRRLYPEPYMRTCGDIDFLYHIEDDDAVCKAMTLNGLHKGVVGKQHSVYKNSIMKMEAHEYLVSDFKEFVEYYKDIWKRANRDGCFFCMNSSDEYVFLLVHAMRHFLEGMFGARTVIDAYLLRRQSDFDPEYTAAELEKLHLSEFAKIVESFADMYFGEECDKLPSVEFEMVMALSGITINKDINASYTFHLKKGHATRTKSVMKRLFLPYSVMAKKYPVLSKMPFLLPFFWVIRIFGSLFCGTARKELRRLSHVDEDAVKNTEDLFFDCGLGHFIDKR